MKHVMPKGRKANAVERNNMVIALSAANSNSKPLLRKPKTVWNERTKKMFSSDVAQRHKILVGLYSLAHLVAGAGIYAYFFMKATGAPV